MTAGATGGWHIARSSQDTGIGSRASIGLIALGPDRIGAWDLERFLAGEKEVAVFSTRVPMEPKATPESLARMRGYLEKAARLLVTGSRLDVIGFSCTSGTVAIGAREVHDAISQARPGIPVSTPIEAGIKALRLFEARRIAILAPYLPETASLISGAFETAGFTVDRRVTFGLDGDREMNGLAPASILDAARDALTPQSDALFISCTGLRTSGLVDGIEDVLGKPVVTSNQALAWDCLRTAGVRNPVTGQGRLFAQF